MRMMEKNTAVTEAVLVNHRLMTPSFANIAVADRFMPDKYRGIGNHETLSNGINTLTTTGTSPVCKGDSTANVIVAGGSPDLAR